MHRGCIFDNRNARRASDEYSSDVTALTLNLKTTTHTTLIVVNTVVHTIWLILTVYQTTKYNIRRARCRPLHDSY